VLGNRYGSIGLCQRILYSVKNLTVSTGIVKVSLVFVRNQMLIEEALQKRALVLLWIKLSNPIIESC